MGGLLRRGVTENVVFGVEDARMGFRYEDLTMQRGVKTRAFLSNQGEDHRGFDAFTQFYLTIKATSPHRSGYIPPNKFLIIEIINDYTLI